MIIFLVAVVSGGDRVGYDAPDHSNGWVRSGRADPTTPMHLYFLLKQTNTDVLEEKFLAISDPFSSQYGQHMSNAAVHTLVAPTSEAVQAARTFIAMHTAATATAATPNSDIIEVVMNVGEVEKAFQTEVNRYSHSVSGETALKATGYSLPSAVSVHIAAVAPLTMLPSQPRSSKKLTKAKDARDQYADPNAILNTPKTLRTLYGVDKVQGTARNNKQAVLGFLGQR